MRKLGGEEGEGCGGRGKGWEGEMEEEGESGVKG